MWVALDGEMLAGGQGYGRVSEFLAAGAMVRIISSYKVMHGKFMVIDDVTVQTGSFN